MEHEEKIRNIFSACEGVKLAYLFGSHARGEAGPLSDYDFAVYFDFADNSDSREARKKHFDAKLDLESRLAKTLETDSVDVVILNDLHKPEMKYHIIYEGKLLYEVEPYKLLVEPRIMNEYFDFRETLRRYNLTKA